MASWNYGFACWLNNALFTYIPDLLVTIVTFGAISDYWYLHQPEARVYCSDTVCTFAGPPPHMTSKKKAWHPKIKCRVTSWGGGGHSKFLSNFYPWAYFSLFGVWGGGDCWLVHRVLHVLLLTAGPAVTAPWVTAGPAQLAWAHDSADKTCHSVLVQSAFEKHMCFLGDLNCTLNNVWWWKSPVGIKRQNVWMRVWMYSICLILVMFGLFIHFWVVDNTQSVKRTYFWFYVFLQAKNQYGWHGEIRVWLYKWLCSSETVDICWRK